MTNILFLCGTEQSHHPPPLECPFPGQICTEVTLPLSWHWHWLNFLVYKLLPMSFTIPTSLLMAPRQILTLSRPVTFPLTNTYQFTGMIGNNVWIYSSVICNLFYDIKNRENNKSASWGQISRPKISYIDMCFWIEFVRYWISTVRTQWKL